MMDKLQKFCVISLTQGGRHADNTVDLQEFMIMPTGAENMEQAIRMCAEVYQFLRIILKQKGLSTAVGDEGGFAPDLSDSESVLEVILEAVKKAGYEPGKDISIAIDAAASELYDEERGVYVFPGEGKMKGEEVLRDSGEMIEYYEKLAEKFPIVSIEDGLEEDDWEGWKQMTKRLGDKIQLVGDDLFVTNIKRLACGIKLGAANAILIKLNQIGTLSEALDAVEMAQKAGYRTVISHRSGESEIPARLRQVHPAVRTEMPNIISFFVSMRHWENWQCMKILLKKMKKIVKKPDKNSELWLKSPSGYVTMKLS